MKKEYFDKAAKLILIIGIVIGASLLSVRAVNYPKLKHDEVISYLVATGHSRLYQTEKPSDRWVKASEWQAFWKLEKVGNFGTIVKDLNATDIHPPLYFWFLNLWSGLFGIHTSTGALLNIPFHILITLIIFLTCRLLKYPQLICATAAVLWMVRSSIIEAGVITRQYSLLGLIVICFIYSAIRFKNNSSVKNTFWMGLFSLLGLLTHYQFVLILGITFAWLVIFSYLRKNPAPIFKVIAAFVASVLIFLLINPGFLQSVTRLQQRQTISLFHSGMPYLFYRSFYDFSLLFLPEVITVSRFSKINMVIFASFLLGLAIYIFRKRSRRSIIENILTEDNFVLVISLLTLVAVVFLYGIRAFPKHAMSVKALMLVSPLLFVVLAQLLTYFNRSNYRFTYIFSFLAITIQIFFGIQRTIAYAMDVKRLTPPDIFSEPVPIILDQTTGGILPQNLWFAHPGSPVYATSQDAIINDFPDFKEYPVLYLIASNDDYYNSPEKHTVVLQTLRKNGYVINELGNNPFIEGKIYELQRTQS